MIRDELANATQHGVLYLRRLVRAQLTLSLLALAAFGGLIGGLPLAVYLLPGLQAVHVFGVPVTILAILWPPFPMLVALGLLYSHRAEVLEDAFRDLVQ